MRYTIFLFVLFALSLCVSAQKRVYVTQRISGNVPDIDGVINESVWDSVEWSGDFLQREPYEKENPSQPTRFKILYDNNNLYVAIRAFDSSPDSITRRMSRRDGFEGDWVEINIDSYHDLQSAFSFTVNAAGVKSDEAVTNDNRWDPSWNPIWFVKTSIDDKGLVAEMQIPFSQLRFGNQDQYIWGLQVNRRLFRKEESSSWQFISPTASGWVHLFGELHGIKGISPRKQREITPYVLGGRKTYQHNPENPFATGREWMSSFGADGKWGITNDFTLDFTINPDFGQVEADPSEVNLTVFETKFDEKRPFFIEGKNILSLNLLNGGGPLAHDNLFYSRRIGRKPGYSPDLGDDECIEAPAGTQIIGAAKITGKTKNGLSLGVLESVTREEIATIDRDGERRDVCVEPQTNYFIARVQQDINEANTQIGGMVTSTNRFMSEDYLKDQMHAQAYTAGIDFSQYWKEKTYYLHFQSAYSHVKGSRSAIAETQTSAPHFFQRPDARHLDYDSTRTSLSGMGGSIQAGRQGNGKISYTFWVAWRSPGFHLNDVGYHNRNDEIQQIAWMQYRETEPKGIFRSYALNINEWYGSSFGGERMYFGGNVNFHITFKNYWRAGTNINRDQGGLSMDFLRGGPALRYDGNWFNFSYINTDSRKKIYFSFRTAHNRVDGNTAQSHSYNFGINWQVMDALKVSVHSGYDQNNTELEWVDECDYDGDKRYVLGSLSQETASLTMRLSYNITPDFTIEFYGMPFISAGDYFDYKYITDPKADEFYNRFEPYEDNQLSYNEDDEEYLIDENLDGMTDCSFGKPDFNVFDFNANLVLRWEYLPGSTFYIVWSQSRGDYFSHGRFRLGPDIDKLFAQTYPHDVLLLKLSYRIGR